MTFTNDDKKLLENSCKYWEGSWSEKIPALLNRLEAAENVVPYAEHERNCVRTFWEAGEPTSDGGYRTKFAGKWYQSKPVNEEPKCNCGLDEAAEVWRKAAGK